MRLRVAQEVPDTEAEGPGKRYAVWVQGCSLRCEGCCNPEMFAPDKGGAEVDVEALASRIQATPGIEGVSVLGGEPFEQADGVAELVRLVKASGLTVMVYSGYTRDELERLAARPNGSGVAAVLGSTDLLVDGRFEQSMPEAKRRWLGSTNQVMHFLTSAYSPTDPRFLTANTVELRYENGKLTINGWPAAADALRRRP